MQQVALRQRQGSEMSVQKRGWHLTTHVFQEECSHIPCCVSANTPRRNTRAAPLLNYWREVCTLPTEQTLERARVLKTSIALERLRKQKTGKGGCTQVWDILYSLLGSCDRKRCSGGRQLLFLVGIEVRQACQVVVQVHSPNRSCSQRKGAQ